MRTDVALASILFVSCLVLPVRSQIPTRMTIGKVKVHLTTTSRSDQLHWDIINESDRPVFVYSYFLYGPAYGRQSVDSRAILTTTPLSLDEGTVNHFPPVLLLMIPAHDDREGYFRDSEIKTLAGHEVSLKIGVGSDPYSVVQNAHALRYGKSQGNPYNAIFAWAKIIESNAVQLPPGK
jgi:hypothetical protein